MYFSMKEELVELKVSDKVFYNPKMHFCRSISSLGIGAIETDLEIADGFSASGIRGIRYLKENENAKNCTFIDCSPSAVKLTEENLKLNKLKKLNKLEKIKNDQIKEGVRIIHGNFNQEIRELRVNLIEIDPFGTPVPHLYDAIRSLKYKKEAYLSISATDVAVLCGPHSNACLKNYHSRSLNNEFTHENGLRILLKRTAETLAEFNFGLTPLFSLSDQHYLKIFIKIKRGDKFSQDSINNLGYISYCNKCGQRSYGKIPEQICKCKEKLQYAGPLWIGNLHDKQFLNKMIKLNKKRDYYHKKQLEKLLELMKNEIDFPPYFFNLHKLARIKRKKSIPKLEDLIKKLRKAGYKAEKTHFSNNAIKTNAELENIMRFY